MRPILGDLAQRQIAQAVLDAVLLHRVAVVARQAGRIEREPDVAEVVLRHFLDAGGGERIDLIVRREVAERKFLRRRERERDEQRWNEAPHPSTHRRSLPLRNPTATSTYNRPVAELHDWVELGKDTISSLKTKDVTNLYALEWPETRKMLIADYQSKIDSDPRRLRRFVRTRSAHAPRPGQTPRAASPRLLPRRLRLVLLLPRLAAVATTASPCSPGRSSKWPATFMIIVVLLAMELIDKIKFRDELELARDLQADLIPKIAAADGRVRDRGVQPHRQYRRRRHLRLRSASRRPPGRSLRRRLGPRHGGGTGDGGRARGVADAARRRSVAARDHQLAQSHPLPHRRSALVFLLLLLPASSATARSSPRSPAIRRS